MERIKFEFCEKENGELYIKTFLNALDGDSYEKIRLKLKSFQDYTIVSFRRSKHTRTLDKKTGLCEVKTTINKSWHRFLGKWVSSVFYVVHAFKKKSNKTPPREIETANKRVKDYFLNKL